MTTSIATIHFLYDADIISWEHFKQFNLSRTLCLLYTTTITAMHYNKINTKTTNEVHIATDKSQTTTEESQMTTYKTQTITSKSQTGQRRVETNQGQVIKIKFLLQQFKPLFSSSRNNKIFTCTFQGMMPPNILHFVSIFMLYHH